MDERELTNCVHDCTATGCVCAPTTKGTKVLLVSVFLCMTFVVLQNCCWISVGIKVHLKSSSTKGMSGCLPGCVGSGDRDRPRGSNLRSRSLLCWSPPE